MGGGNLLIHARTGHRLLGVALICAILGALFATPEPAQATARTYYLSPTGRDTGATDTGSLSQPWRTFMYARSFLQPGDTLVVRGGLYVEQVQYNMTLGGRLDPKQGTSSAPIRVVAAPRERPVIKGVLIVNGARYWSFEGINVTWDPAKNKRDTMMVRFVDGIGWQFVRGEVWGSKSYGAFRVAGTRAGQPANWKVAENCIHDALPANGRNQDHTMYIDTGLSAGAGVIERNIVFNAPNGALIKLGPSGSNTTGGSANVRVQYNTLYGGAHNLLLAYGSRNIYAYRNIVGRPRGESWYPNFRGYSASGGGNVARTNLGFAAGALITNTDSRAGWRDGGANRFGVDPKFNGMTCGRFKPTNPAAVGYGRYAP